MTDRREFTSKVKVAFQNCAHCRTDFERYRISAARASRPQFCSKGCQSAHRAKQAHEELQRRIWLRIDRSGGMDSCWSWQGRLDPNGYGRVDSRGRPLLAHRVAYQASKGPILGGLVVCHRCDNPKCCNPQHLFLGSIADNNADRVAKGRTRTGTRRGAACNKAKLTADDARLIFASNEGVSSLAVRFGVSRTAIRYIRSGRNWACATGAK